MAGPRPLRIVRRGCVGYREGLALQRDLVEARRAGSVPDTLVLLEHPHVITLGSASSPEHVLADEAELARLGVEVVETGRGGDVTYHGPGQLVGYPVLALEPGRRDLHRYLRDLEEVLIRSLDALGIEGRRREGATGVWTGSGKIAAIGIRVSSGWITSHGFALNVRTDLGYFETIVPCGLDDRRVTTVELEAGRPVRDEEVRGAVVEAFGAVLGRAPEEG